MLELMSTTQRHLNDSAVRPSAMPADAHALQRLQHYHRHHELLEAQLEQELEHEASRRWVHTATHLRPLVNLSAPLPHAGRAAWQPAALPHDASLHARWHHWRRRHFDRHWHGREYKLGVLWTASVVLFCVLARRIVDSATRGYVDVDDGAPETPGTASNRPGGQRLDAV